jgi:hypothetical protein
MMRRPQWPKWVGNGSPRFRRALATDELPRSARNGHCERTPKTGIQFSGTIDVPDCRLPFPRRKPLQRQFRIRWSCSLLGLRHAGGGTQGESTGCKCWLHAKTLECRLLTGPQSTGPQFALWLADPLALYGADSAPLAPGYVNPKADGKQRTVKAM